MLMCGLIVVDPRSDHYHLFFFGALEVRWHFCLYCRIGGVNIFFLSSSIGVWGGVWGARHWRCVGD